MNSSHVYNVPPLLQRRTTVQRSVQNTMHPIESAGVKYHFGKGGLKQKIQHLRHDLARAIEYPKG